jgi:hypothetical protein
MTRKRKRLLVVLLGLGMFGTASALVLFAFNDNLVFFMSPSPPDRVFGNDAPLWLLELARVPSDDPGIRAPWHDVDVRVRIGCLWLDG